MTTTEVVLLALLGAVVVALLATLRRPSEADLPRLLEAHVGRLAAALEDRARDDRDLRRGMADTRVALEELRARDEERRGRDDEARLALRRLEGSLLGAASRGRVGENVVWEALCHLPPDMVDRNFHVGGRVVEFSLRLPDGRRLPVDSKWSGVPEVEALEEAGPEERSALARDAERLVAARAREVAKYLDPSLTTPFAVAAVPDSVYALLRKAHLEAYAAGVLLVPYASALPVLLALYSLCSRLGPDVAEVGWIVGEVTAALDAIERALEHSVERAAKMSQNAGVEIRSQIGRARGALANARPSLGEPEARVIDFRAP